MENNHKINLENMFDEYGNSDYDRFILEFKSEIESGIISQECLNKMAGIVLDINNVMKAILKDKIKKIYIAILSIKYCDGPDKFDIGKIGDIVSNIAYLKNCYILDYFNLDDICNEVYSQLYNFNAIYSPYMKLEMEEEFKAEHLLDIKYHLDIFAELGKNNKEFLEIVTDENLWRFIYEV